MNLTPPLPVPSPVAKGGGADGEINFHETSMKK